jgi:hypothetical protein
MGWRNAYGTVVKIRGCTAKKYPSDITRAIFFQILPMLESARRKTKPKTADLYEVLCGMLYLLRTGCQVVDHSGPVFECPSGVRPHVSPLGLARTGVEQADRRLVGVKHARAEHEGPVRVIQGQQLRPGLTAPSRQRRARRVHARAGIDLLLPVVRKMIDKPTDHGVGLQGRRWQRVVKDLGRGALLHHQLAAPN